MPKSLNGWQRLWVVLTAAWTLWVGLLTWNSWPPPPFDPSESVPINESRDDPRFVPDTRDPRFTPDTPENVVPDEPEIDFSGIPLAQGVDSSEPVFDAEKYRLLGNDSAQPEEPLRWRATQNALLLWLLPPIAIYGSALTARWVYRGFRPTPPPAGS